MSAFMGQGFAGDLPPKLFAGVAIKTNRGELQNFGRRLSAKAAAATAPTAAAGPGFGRSSLMCAGHAGRRGSGLLFAGWNRCLHENLVAPNNRRGMAFAGN